MTNKVLIRRWDVGNVTTRGVEEVEIPPYTHKIVEFNDILYIEITGLSNVNFKSHLRENPLILTVCNLDPVTERQLVTNIQGENVYISFDTNIFWSHIKEDAVDKDGKILDSYELPLSSIKCDRILRYHVG